MKFLIGQRVRIGNLFGEIVTQEKSQHDTWLVRITHILLNDLKKEYEAGSHYFGGEEIKVVLLGGLLDDIDLGLSPEALKECIYQYGSKAWDESCKFPSDAEKIKELEDAMNACLYIAWLKERGFSISK